MHSDPWPMRPLLFAVLGVVSALSIYYLAVIQIDESNDNRLPTALAASIAGFSLLLAMVVRKSHLPGGVIFALIAALVIGGISYWRLTIDWLHEFNFMALVVALFVCAPFYQTSTHSSWRDYRALHHHAWGNAVLLPLGLLFVLLTFGMAYLLAELFSLVGIEILKQWLDRDATPWVIAGGSLGASIGVLREYDRIISSSQQLVQGVFSLLTTPLALGLGTFLLALPFTGLETLWEKTHNSSTVLFACAVAAIVFVNAVVRDDKSSQGNNRILQFAARVLAVCLAPLAAIAAIAIQLRVKQYGWTPDRLWAAVVCALLIGYGVMYLLAAMRRLTFNESIRRANLYLAIIVCAMAVLLATPLLDFGAYSVKDQLARFQDNRVPEEDLDLVAMAFDFGPAGRQALQALKVDASPSLAIRIQQVEQVRAEGSSGRYLLETSITEPNAEIEVLVGPADIPGALRRAIGQHGRCRFQYCYLLWSDSEKEVALVEQVCHTDADRKCEPAVSTYRLHTELWIRQYGQNDSLWNIYQSLDPAARPPTLGEFTSQLDDAAKAGRLEVRPVQRKQVFIGDTAIGPTLN